MSKGFFFFFLRPNLVERGHGHPAKGEADHLAPLKIKLDFPENQEEESLVSRHWVTVALESPGQPSGLHLG